MFGIDFGSFSPWINALIFLIAAGIIWFSGRYLAYLADAISDTTGLGKAFMGLLFLAVATELPEIGTTVSAALSGNASLAVNNIFGGITLQTVVLAIVDLVVIGGALTYFTPRPILLLEGTLLVLLLGLTLAGILAGEFWTFFHVDGWTILLLLAYLLSLYMLHRYEGHERWQPIGEPEEGDLPQPEVTQRPVQDAPATRFHDWNIQRQVLFFLLNGAVILVAGFTLARVAEALAQQTGLGTSFIGATLLAGSTSLPELSTSLSAARLGAYSMAVSNIFGSNAIMLLLLFIADVAYRDGSILAEAGTSALFGAAMGIVVTCTYLVGLIEWKDRTIFGMGIDSAVVVVLYIINLGVLYMLR